MHLDYVAVSILEFRPPLILLFFFFNDTATTEIYTLSLHDALPISCCQEPWGSILGQGKGTSGIPFSPPLPSPKTSTTSLDSHPHPSVFGCSHPPTSPSAWGDPSPPLL